MKDPVLAHLAGEHDAIVKRLLDFVRIPSVSTDPSYASGMKDAQAFLLTRLGEMGLTNVHPVDGGGHPALYGEWMAAPDRPTILVYGHYDVQPPDPLEKWDFPPFEPEVRDGRIYGRGVSDDKGPSSIALESIAAFLRVEGSLPFNLKVLLEGEEELGSPTLGKIVRKHRDLLNADAVLSADGASWRPDLVTVNVGSRGNAGFEFTVRTAVKDLHSGRYGGVVPNALHVMAGLVAGLHDENGGVAVAGFYDGVRDVEASEREALGAIPFDETDFYAAIGSTPRGEPEFTTLERLWSRPCLDVNGMWGGYSGPGAKTVVPNEAHAKVTIRSVPNQDPGRILRRVIDHLNAQCPAGCEIEFEIEAGESSAYEVPGAHPLLHIVEAALAEAHGSNPHRIKIGGTLPMSDIVRRELGVDTVMLSFSIADEDFHAPNEFFRISSIEVGLRAWTAVLRGLGKANKKDFARFLQAK